MSAILEKLIDVLPKIKPNHAPTNELYGLLKEVATQEVTAQFGESVANPVAKPFAPFGELNFPFQRMGAITSVELFGLDELIIFSFYWANRNRYKNTADIGANIGLHSIMMSRCGYQVEAYEPDPWHFELLQRNLRLNDVTTVHPINAAVSSKPGTANFVRVLGNTTGSHLAGAKANPYGELETFPVELRDIHEILAKADLVKMDVEGHEKEILLSTGRKDWEGTDLIVEIGTPENASAVYEHFRNLDLSLYAQKTGWKKVEQLSDMPGSYKDGSLFLTAEKGWSF